MKKILILPLFSFLLFILFSAFSHPFYVSVSQINYNAEAESLEIACKIFIDDLEEALKLGGAENLYLGLEKESAEADELIAAYLEKHLTISVNGEIYTGVFLGKEITEDVVWSYIEMSKVPYPSEFSIDNTLLLEVSENQQNIVHIRVNGKEKSLRLFRGRSKEILSY